MSTKIIHKAESRGHADHGWLNTYHTFSFANYYNPERIRFGVLRVLNDDTISGGSGFGTHPHENMEIITIPIEGALEHKDSMGNHGIIESGEIQVMSAGTGIEHSEFNANPDKEGKFLQIWIFPDAENHQPRYGQHRFQQSDFQNSLYNVVSPFEGGAPLWIHQNAWLSIGQFTKEMQIDYKLKSQKNGVYLFVIEGSIQVDNQILNRRDGIGIGDVNFVEIKVTTGTQILLMEIPIH